MRSDMIGFRTFVKKHVSCCVQALKAPSTLPLNSKLYLGNEAADADSIVSSLCCSYYDFLNGNHGQDVDNVQNQAFIPFVSINRREIHLRRDVEVLLNKVDISLSDLVCLDDIPDAGLDSANVRLSLLDHNALSLKEDMFIKRICNNEVPSVYEIIDHHADAGKHLECSGSLRNIAYNNELNVAEAGSTCTLLAEKFLSFNKPFDSDVATLLMGVIALDTVNMSPQAGKGTPRDASALEKLSAFTSHSIPTLYNELSNAKLDRNFWNSLSASDCILLDYKLFQAFGQKSSRVYNIGMAAVLLPVNDIMKKTDLVTTAKVYLSTCDVLVIMTLHDVGDVIHRDVMFISKSEELLQNIEDYLVKTANDIVDLKLSNVNIREVSSSLSSELLERRLYARAYNQGNIKASRKQLAPILTKYFENL